jgi:endonuclease/exonuclease/phosphatase family metal-dependent hydrolase
VGLPRTSPDSVLFTTYNMLNLFLEEEGPEHYGLVVDTIRALGTDVLAVQELRAPDLQVAVTRLRRLADDVGMRCTLPGSDGADCGALAMGAHGFHAGLIWRHGIEPVPGSLRRYGQGDFWHSLAFLTLDIGGRPVRHASHHATPFGRLLRADQNERLVAALTVPPGGPPTLVGADWNTECADRVPDESGNWVLYEPGDPYADVPWSDRMINQCDWDYDEHGQRRHWVDRRPGDVLWAGGLHDVAAALRAPWQPTAGHHPSDPFGRGGIRRRIDAIRVTTKVLPALRAHHVTDTELARRASDHLPVTAEYLPSAIT